MQQHTVEQMEKGSAVTTQQQVEDQAKKHIRNKFWQKMRFLAYRPEDECRIFRLILQQSSALPETLNWRVGDGPDSLLLAWLRADPTFSRCCFQGLAKLRCH